MSEDDQKEILETQNDSIKKALETQLQKNQNNEQIFIRLSALLGELVALSNRTTYVATMVKDIIDGRNQQASPSS
jgi:uncharacterized protein YigA (DUF484 family)